MIRLQGYQDSLPNSADRLLGLFLGLLPGLFFAFRVVILLVNGSGTWGFHLFDGKHGTSIFCVAECHVIILLHLSM